MATNKHGGTREGAGRKQLYGKRTVQIGSAVPVDLAAEFESLVKRRGWNKSRAIVEAIRLLLKTCDGR